MKIVVVGGASTYTPELIDGFARQQDLLPLDEVVLVDPAADRLELVAGMGERMLRAAGEPYRLTRTGDLRSALEGADVVLIQIRVGGQETRAVDESFPASDPPAIASPSSSVAVKKVAEEGREVPEAEPDPKKENVKPTTR